MANQDMELLASMLVSLEKRHDALARARQLQNSSVSIPGGSSVRIADSTEVSQDAYDGLGSLVEDTNIVADNTDSNAVDNVAVPGWIIEAAASADIAWDSTQFAVDLTKQLETELAEAQLELDQAMADSAVALAEANTARQEAALAVQEAENAITAAGVATDLSEAAQTAANGKSRVWYQGTAPAGTGHKTGDTWFDTSNGNRVTQWDGDSWESTQFGTGAIATAAITNALIADATIESAKIANLDAAKITTGYLAAARIQAGTIVADKLASNAVTAVKIAADAVTAEKIFAGAVTTDKLNALAVTADKIAALTITADKIATNAITAGKIQGQAIDGMTITGALIRTAPSGQRVQLDVNGLRTFNAAGTETSRLNADGTGLVLSGKLTIPAIPRPGYTVDEMTITDAAITIWDHDSEGEEESSFTRLYSEGLSFYDGEEGWTVGAVRPKRSTLSATSGLLFTGSGTMLASDHTQDFPFQAHKPVGSLGIVGYNYSRRFNTSVLTVHMTGSVAAGAVVELLTPIEPIGGKQPKYPSLNVQGALWLNGGYTGTAFVRPNGTVAMSQSTGASRALGQFTIVWNHGNGDT